MHQSFNQYKSLFNKVKYKRYINFNKKIINRIRNRKQKHPIVSIITVVKNDPYYLEKTIKSVINQTYNNIEYIIIDGKSKKKTTSIIKKYKKKISIILSENDKGIYDAMNKGIVLASGEIISIINSGDLFFKNAVKNAVKNLKKVDYLFGPVKRTGDRTYFNYKPNKINHKFNIFPSHSVSFFVKRRIHEELGLYNISFKLSADYDFIFKLIKNRKKFTI